MSPSEYKDLATMFAAGAYSVASEAGMPDWDARSFASGMLKTSAKRRLKVVDEGDDEDEEEESWWSRNKGWALPTAIGLGAFLVGSDAGRYGRKDRNYFSNAGNRMLERLKSLFGIPDSDRWRMMKDTPPVLKETKVPEKPVKQEFAEYPKGSV